MTRTLPDIAPFDSVATGARLWAEAGFAVIPVDPVSGGALVPSWTTRATTDPTQVKDWWDRWPEAAIGVVAAPSGLVIVDVDHPERLPETIRETLVSVPTGFHSSDAGDPVKGHYFYEAVPGVEVKTKGWSGPDGTWGETRTDGYVIVAPSPHRKATERPTARYEVPADRTPIVPLPEPLRAVFATQERAPVDVSGIEPTGRSLDWFVEKWHEDVGAGEAWHHATRDRMKDAYRESLAGAPYSTDDVEAAFWDAQQEYAEPWPERRFRQQAKSHLDAAEADPEIRFDGVVEFPVLALAEQVNKFRAKALGRGALARLPEPTPLITDTIDKHTVALLAGSHGIGKSFVALDWGACVATGADWMGRRVERGKVLYIVGEGAYGVHRRLEAWEVHRGHTIDDEHFVVIPEAVQIAQAGELDAFIEYVDEEKFDLVIVDTLARSAVGLDENSARDMGVFIDAAEHIKRASGGTVLIVHHTGKDKATVRGSSALEGAMDTVYKVAGDSARFTLSREKRKDGPRDDEHVLRLGQALDSCVVLPVGDIVRPSAADALPGLHKAYSAIADVHGTTAETRTTLVATLSDKDRCGMSRTQAYESLRRLGELGVLRAVDPDAKVLRLFIDNSEAVKNGFPRVEPFRLPDATGPSVDEVVED